MEDWNISLARTRVTEFSPEKHKLVCVDDFMASPDTAIRVASLQKFAKITPQYPGVRAPLPQTVLMTWLKDLSPLLDSEFEQTPQGWEIQAWFSLVTTPGDQLIPLQRFPHVDGTDPRQLAMMLYLDHTDHGGTGFFRHRSTGLESLTDQTFPEYRAALEREVKATGLPPSEYVTDGSPHFERIFASDGTFNQAVFYRGNVLHSGVINREAELSADPAKGRLTINAFFRPIG